MYLYNHCPTEQEINLHAMKNSNNRNKTMPYQDIINADQTAVAAYNSRAKEEYKLRTELGPCPHEGDINNSPIVLLLANPGYDEKSSVNDHTYSADGWPLAGLNPSAPVGMRKWWYPRLKQLCDQYGEQYISTKVAALQINPWASTSFDADLKLPSQQMQIDLAEKAVQRGAILIVMRAAKMWHSSAIIDQYSQRYKTNSARCSYLTQGNLQPEIWTKINDALKPQ
jgi:hypothetical protein